MSLASISGFGADMLEIDRPYNGAWILRAKLDIADNEPPPLGPFSCIFDDGLSVVTYTGTLISSRADTGDAYVVGIGGQGKLGVIVNGIDYSQPQPRTIAKDIIEACGETIGDMSVLDGAKRIEPAYSRLSGRASVQLQTLCELVGVRWYTRIDGAINISALEWIEYDNDPFVVHNPNENGTMIAEPNLPDIEPSMIVGGFKIARVRYFIDENGLYARLGVHNG